MKKTDAEVRKLMCQLTDDEQRMRGIDLASMHKELFELNDEKRELAQKIKKATIKREMLAVVVKNKHEERDVVCTLHPDYAADSMTIRRTDTGDIVCIRQLDYSDKHSELPMDGLHDDEKEHPLAMEGAEVTVSCGDQSVTFPPKRGKKK